MPRYSAASDFLDDSPNLREVITGGIGDEIRMSVSGGAHVVKVTRDGRDYVFVLDRSEYREWHQRWQAHQPRPAVADHAAPKLSGLSSGQRRH